MFSDQSLVYSHSNFLIKNVNTHLTAYATWFRLNKLSLNTKNSNYIILNGKNHIKSQNRDCGDIPSFNNKIPWNFC